MANVGRYCALPEINMRSVEDMQLGGPLNCDVQLYSEVVECS